MKLTIAISPCPNDTFMFHAMLHGLVDTEGLDFEAEFNDIEQLNENALGGRPAVSKISYAVLPAIANSYFLLSSGSAMGFGNGPLLVGRGVVPPGPDTKAAIPGKYTTANRLLGKFFPQITDKTPVLFSEITARVASGEFDCGVLIHESRFTYEGSGLRLLADLGALWEENSGTAGLPLPLGGIVAARSLGRDMAAKIDRVLRRSVEYAVANPQASHDFVKRHAQETDDNVIRQHIEMFVNEYSVDFGEAGQQAIREFTGLESADITI